MTDRVANETALTEVMEFMASPPARDTPEDARFGQRLLQVLAASIVDGPLDEDDPVCTAELTLDADLRARLEKASLERNHNAFGGYADGMGPTLGGGLNKE
ncbi:hypothetical protein [Caulobacter sp. DWR2-3-1b2]|uniref:hypothetical protein n=1 Tax=unclassified Caulobacter TaxID=2648921 RepID=UPI003CEB2F71